MMRMRKQSSPLSIVLFLIIVAGVFYLRQRSPGTNNTLWGLATVLLAICGVIVASIRKYRNKRATGTTTVGTFAPSFGSMMSDVMTQFMSAGQPMSIPGLPAGTVAVHLPVLDPEAPQYFIMWKLSGSIGGQLILQRQGQKPLWGHESELESIEFNKETQVYASSRQLAFQLLAPDFMDWYLQSSTPPALVIKDSDAWMYFIPPFIPQEEVIPKIVQTVARAIEKSGALVKNT